MPVDEARIIADLPHTTILLPKIVDSGRFRLKGNDVMNTASQVLATILRTKCIYDEILQATCMLFKRVSSIYEIQTCDTSVGYTRIKNMRGGYHKYVYHVYLN